MKIHNIVILIPSISFFTAIAMDTSWEVYNDDESGNSFEQYVGNKEKEWDGWKAFLTDDSLPSVPVFSPEVPLPNQNEEKNENNEALEATWFYATCSSCYKFFAGLDKKIVREILEKHLAENHPTVLMSEEDINKQVRNYIGYWEVKSHCPYFGCLSGNGNGKICSYSLTHFVPCNVRKPINFHLIDHCLNFHSILIDGNSLDEKEVKISGPFSERPASSSSKNHTSCKKKAMSLSLEERFLKNKKVKEDVYRITYTCPFRGQVVKKQWKDEPCDFHNEISITAATHKLLMKKITSIVFNIYRHVCSLHGDKLTGKDFDEIKRWREETQKNCVTWEKLSEN